MIATAIDVSRQVHAEAKSKLTNDTQADPLLLASRLRSDDGSADLFIALIEVLDGLLGLLLDVGDGNFLLNNEGIHVLEQLCQFNQLLLDLCQLNLSVLDGVQHGLCLALSVALHHSLLEYLTAGILYRSLDFPRVGIGTHDLVLSGHLILCLLSELCLNLLVRVNGLL